MLAMSEADALLSLNRWAGLALPISASSYSAGRLMLRLSGSESALRAAKQKLGGQQIDHADAVRLRLLHVRGAVPHCQ